MVSIVSSKPSFRLRGRSILAFVLEPEAPFADWLKELDQWIERSKGFFSSKPVILNLTSTKVTREEFSSLVGEMQARAIHIIGAEGVEACWLGPGIAPLPSAGKSPGITEMVDTGAAAKAAAKPIDPAPAAAALEAFCAQHKQPSGRPNALPAEIGASSSPEKNALLIDQPVRSGQTVVFGNGDVTLVGQLASGAEIIAGGSIHVHGALRGRAIAGSTGHQGARIFCSRLEAELIAIDGLYKTADDIDPGLIGQPVQIWLEDDAMKISKLG